MATTVRLHMVCSYSRRVLNRTVVEIRIYPINCIFVNCLIDRNIRNLAIFPVFQKKYFQVEKMKDIEGLLAYFVCFFDILHRKMF